jgi:hypothetical protein
MLTTITVCNYSTVNMLNNAHNKRVDCKIILNKEYYVFISRDLRQILFRWHSWKTNVYIDSVISTSLLWTAYYILGCKAVVVLSVVTLRSKMLPLSSEQNLKMKLENSFRYLVSTNKTSRSHNHEQFRFNTHSHEHFKTYSQLNLWKGMLV